MIKKVDVTIVCKAEKDNVFDGFDDEKIIKILDESAGKVNNESCKVSIQPNLKWQKLKEWLEEKIKENEVLVDPYCKEIEQVFIAGGLARLSEIQKQMQELEGEDENTRK